MKEQFGAKEDDSLKLRFHTQTAGCTLTAQQPENNIVRVTLQALASVLGGTQSLHTNSKDEALSLPSEQAAQTALRTQQVIAYESGVVNTVDPLGGSFFIEYLTDQIEKEAKKYIDFIQGNGGALWAVESGFYSKEIQKSAYEYQKQIEKNEKIIVGVNRFEIEKEEIKDIFKIDLKTQKEQIKRLNQVKKERDNNKVEKLLKALKMKAQSDENLMHCILECVEAYATIGEMCNVLREVWGEYRESMIL
jgi:methylmalonyl-CoA mutase N-terminal domain/subunit